jgi:hypothetical protein
MAKKKVTQSSITWRVGDGPIHEIPDGATVTFKTPEYGKKMVYIDESGQIVTLGPAEKARKKERAVWKDAGNPSAR